MKKEESIRIRTSSDAHKAFADACRASGRKQSDAIRDLCEATVAYVEANKRAIPRTIKIVDGDGGNTIPTLWLGRVLMRVRNLDELKDVVSSVLIAGFELGWNSEIGPGADHIAELDTAIDRRLSRIRKAK